MTSPDSMKCSRRAFAKGTLGAALIASTSALAKVFAGYVPKHLTRPELDSVKALMSRLIPKDESSGGAVEAGAHVYLDQALGAFHARHLDGYRTALAQLDRIAQREAGTRFAALPTTKLDALITRMEKGELPKDSFADGGAAFFNLLRRHTLEGFLSDPIYGGNQDFVGWHVIGYNGIQLVYSPEAQALNGRDEREARSIAAFGGSPMP